MGHLVQPLVQTPGLSAAQMQLMCAHTLGWLHDRSMCLFLVSSTESISLATEFLLPGNLNPSVDGPSCPPSQIILVSQITTAEKLQFEFSHQALNNQSS